MSVIKFNRNFSTLFSWDTDENPTTEQDYQNAVKNWTETEMNIVDTLLWQPTTEYATGNIVKTPSLPSQYVLRCAEAGTSGSTEPDYSGAGVGDTVTDGSVEWVIVSLATGNAADVDASNIGVNAEVDNSEAWASAIGGGAIAEDDGKLVKGGTVYAVTSELASDIATNTEAIATNTANIEASAVKIDIDDKRISNIEKLLQGNLYDYQTDSNSAYTKTVPSGAMPYASLDSIGGKTLVWNQLYKNSATSGTVGTLTYTNNGDGSTTINGTNTSGSSSIVPLNLAADGLDTVAGHKYYIGNLNGSGTTYYMSLQLGVNQTVVDQMIYTETVSKANARCYLIVLNNAVTNITIYPIVVDLTLMFGSGNEPTTVEEFESMFPADYYAYNAGTLLSASVDNVVSKGKNLAIVTGTLADGNIAIANFGKNTDFDALTISFQCNAVTFTNASASAFNLYTDVNNYKMPTSIQKADGTYFTVNMTPYTGRAYLTVTNTTVKGIKFYTYSGSYAKWSGTFSDVQVEANSTMTDYSAPFTITTPIPASIQALEGYGWSAGTAYNYIDYERKVFVQNVGKYTFTGNETWSDVPNAVFTLAITDALYGFGQYVVCDRYVGMVSGIGSSHTDTQKSCWLQSTSAYKRFYVCDSNYDRTTIGASMVGVEVFYPLATPIETDISAYLTDDNLISVESGGSLTFPNSNGTDYQIPVPSAETYMVDLQEAI